MNTNQPVYLGDGLYASFDGWQIKLMANSSENPTDVVYLEPGVLTMFKRFIDECFNQTNDEEI